MRSTILAVAAAATLATAMQGGDPMKPPPKKDVGAGRIAWFDITTKDLAKSKEFYGKLFDWTFTALKGTDLAVEIVSGGEPIGTLRVAHGNISGFNGVVYVQVADVQASCKQATELGATVIPGFPFNLLDRTGAIGLFIDPSGHPMGMYSRTPLPAASPPAK
jgi:predicted enzyme related to lactoylglutathione lyase